MGVTVTETGLAYLQDKIDRINRRAVKMQVDGLKLKIEPLDPVQDEEGAYYLQYHAEIVGKPPVMGDYCLVAIKERMGSEEGATVIRAVPLGCLPPETIIPEWFASDDMFCQHCHSNRNRHEVFLLKKVMEEQSQYLQVGRTCLKDFLGVDVTTWLNRAEWMLDIEEMYTMAGIYSQPDKAVDKRYLPMSQVFKYVYTTAERRGFVSKRKAMEDESVVSTISEAMHFHHEDTRPGRKDKDREPSPTEQEASEAANVLNWFKTEILPVPEKHYFGDEVMWYNLKNMCDNDMISFKMTGLSVIPYVIWLKHKADQAREKERGISNWMGIVGEKITTPATVVYTQTIDSMFGPVRLHKFLTPEKNILCWFQSSGSTLQLDEGDSVIISGKVKEHKGYRGQKETVLKGVKQIVS